MEKKEAAVAAPKQQHKDIVFGANPQMDGDALLAELQQLEAQAVSEPTQCGTLTEQSAYETIVTTVATPPRRPLYKRLWHEGEMACLFGDTNCGKSILAVQIADEIVRAGERILYVDLELSREQFTDRYSDPATGDVCAFPLGFRRAEISPQSFTYDGKFEESLLKDIERTALAAQCTVIIIDNLTYLCSNMESGRDASQFMFRLRELKVKWGWSILIIAHTPKRPAYAPITLNDLAGSRKLAIFFDAIFALGVAGNNSDGRRYIVQLKCRKGEYTHDSSNVKVCHIVKDGPWLHLAEDGTAAERDLLSAADPAGQRVRDLRAQGMKQADIAATLTAEGIPTKQYQVSRILHRKYDA